MAYEDELKTLLASCSLFQTWCGAEDADEAAEHIFVHSSASTAFNRPHCIIAPATETRTVPIGLGTLVKNGTIEIAFEKAAGAGSEAAEFSAFSAAVRAIADQIYTQSYQGAYLVVRGVLEMGGPWRTRKSEGDPDDLYIAEYSVEYGLDGIQ